MTTAGPSEHLGDLDRREEVLTRLGDQLRALGFTSDGVLARVGAEAFAALSRSVGLPARRALAGQHDPLALLIRAFLLAEPTELAHWEASLAQDFARGGLVVVDGELVRPQVAVQPYFATGQDWYLASDIGTPDSVEHVLGLGGAAVTLSQVTPRRRVGRVLDLGCGCGVQGLLASSHSDEILATDTNPHALEMTLVSAALSGVPAGTISVASGSLFEPVAGQVFDLIVSNPPFVISPGKRFTYRDAGLPGDEISRQVIRGAAGHLAPGGVAAVLGNWLHVDGEDWAERVGGWVAGTGASAWVVQREVTSVLDYSLLWLRDAGIAPGVVPPGEAESALGEWLDSFQAQGASAVGFGWVLLTRDAQPDPSREPWLVAEDLRSGSRLPTPDEVDSFLGRCTALSAIGAVELLGLPLSLTPGTLVGRELAITQVGCLDRPEAVLSRPGEVGPGGWRPAIGLPAAVLEALLEFPELPIGRRLDGVAEASGLDPLDILPGALIGLRELLRAGLIAVTGTDPN